MPCGHRALQKVNGLIFRYSKDPYTVSVHNKCFLTGMQSCRSQCTAPARQFWVLRESGSDTLCGVRLVFIPAVLQHLCAYVSETFSPVSGLIFALSHWYPCDGYFKWYSLNRMHCLQVLLFQEPDQKGVSSNNRSCFIGYSWIRTAHWPEIHWIVPVLFHIPVVEDCNCPVCTIPFHFVSFFKRASLVRDFTSS